MPTNSSNGQFIHQCRTGINSNVTVRTKRRTYLGTFKRKRTIYKSQRFYKSKVVSQAKINGQLNMAMSECGLSKIDKRRLGKRCVADREALDDQDGGVQKKTRKYNEPTKKGTESVIYPWMLEFRCKQKGKIGAYFEAFYHVPFIIGLVLYFCPPHFKLKYVVSNTMFPFGQKYQLNNLISFRIYFISTIPH